MSTLASMAAAAPLTAAWGAHALYMRHRLTVARRDPLTGLPTRAVFTTKARRMVANPAAVVLLIDLDGFKALNDSRGHAAGDAALVAVADRLTAWTGSRGIAGRLGGDEFAAVITATSNLRSDLRQLHVWLTQPVPYPGGRLRIGASIGAMPVAHLPVPDLSAARAVTAPPTRKEPDEHLRQVRHVQEGRERVPRRGGHRRRHPHRRYARPPGRGT